MGKSKSTVFHREAALLLLYPAAAAGEIKHAHCLRAQASCITSEMRFYKKMILLLRRRLLIGSPTVYIQSARHVQQLCN